MIVHQILSGAGPSDAVTGQALAYRRHFRSWGWGGGDYAAELDPRVGSAVRSLRALQAGPDDVLLLHYSAYAPKLKELLELSNRKLLHYHNVTPARWFWEFEPRTAVHCSLGRSQLSEFVAGVDRVTAVSHYNAEELVHVGAAGVEVIPILFEPPPPPLPPRARAGPPTVLFVGRLAPHKRQDELIAVFSLLRRHRLAEARLVIVGEPLTKGYGERLAALGSEYAPGAVTLESHLTSEALWRRYAAGDLFACLSEHEGFCVPLLEAFHAGVPVLARPSGGIPEVAGDAALLCDDRDPAVIAELMHLALTDDELRGELVARGRARLDQYAPELVVAKLRAVVEGVAAGAAVQ